MKLAWYPRHSLDGEWVGIGGHIVYAVAIVSTQITVCVTIFGIPVFPNMVMKMADNTKPLSV